MIPRNTTIPSKKTQIFSTYSDNQPSVEIVVLQGERPMARDNKTLGTFRLDGIPPAPRGIPQIEVTFDIDANGILHVSAKDLGTGKDQKITIQGSSGLSKDEVEKMTKEAELHAAEDKKRREAVEARNQLDTTIYQLEKTLKEAGDKLPADKKAKVEAALADAKKDLESNDGDRMKAALEKLSRAAPNSTPRPRRPPAAAQGGAGGRARAGGPAARAEGREEARRRRRRLRGRRRGQGQEIIFHRSVRRSRWFATVALRRKQHTVNLQPKPKTIWPKSKSNPSVTASS